MRTFLALLIMALFFVPDVLPAGTVPTMTREELKARLGTEKLVILDVRTGRDWSTSDHKIPGAIRIDGKDLAVVKDYSPDHTFVLYCA